MPYVPLEQDALSVQHDTRSIFDCVSRLAQRVRQELRMYVLLQDDDSPERSAEKALWHARRIRLAFW
jgi:hypothetical protein